MMDNEAYSSKVYGDVKKIYRGIRFAGEGRLVLGNEGYDTT
jgi:hypothetical protein